MNIAVRSVDKVRVSRAGHTFHKRWATIHSNPANEASSSRSISRNTNQATHLEFESGM